MQRSSGLKSLGFSLIRNRKQQWYNTIRNMGNGKRENDEPIITESGRQVFGDAEGDIHIIGPDEYRPHIQAMADKILQLNQVDMRLFHLCCLKKLGRDYNPNIEASATSTDAA